MIISWRVITSLIHKDSYTSCLFQLQVSSISDGTDAITSSRVKNKELLLHLFSPFATLLFKSVQYLIKWKRF